MILYSCHDPQDETVSAQEIKAVEFSTSLSNQRVMAIAQDSSGQVWLGTFRGLNRYNVHGIHQYFCTDDSLDLPDNQITCLFRDSRHRFWVGTIHGVAMYTGQDKFKRVTIDCKKDYAGQFFENNSGELFLNLGNSLAKYDEADGKFKSVVHNLHQVKSMHCNAFFDRNDDLWIAAEGCLRRYDNDSYELLDSLPAHERMSCSYYDADNRIVWMGGDSGLWRFDLVSRHFSRPTDSAQSAGSIRQIFPYSHHQLLITTSGRGMYLYDVTSGRVIDRSDPNFPFNPPDFSVTAIFRDSWGNVWFGAYDQGYAVCNSSSRKFNTVNKLNDAFCGKSVMSVDCDRLGNLWIVTMRDGVYYYDFRRGTLHKIDTASITGGADMLSGTISSVLIDDDGFVWMASLTGNRLYKGSYNPEPGSFAVIETYDVESPLSMAQGCDGTIIVGLGVPKIAYMRPGEPEFSTVTVDPGEQGFASAIQPLADNTVLIGVFMSHIVRFDTQSGRFLSTDIDEEDWGKSISRGGYIPTDFYLDSFGELWIGTIGNGVLRYTCSSGKLERIPGAPCTDICSFVEDKQGHMWISTQYGLGRIDRTTMKFTNYDADDGIGGNQFYDRAACVLPDGRLVFGGTHGITIFDPRDVSSIRPVSLIFQDLKIHNKIIHPSEHPEIIQTALYNCPDINLGHSQNGFSISFAALDNSSKGVVRYQYLLDGHDPRWVDAHNINEAYYGNIPAGCYTFRVRIVGNDGVPVDNSEISLKVNVASSPWLSLWAMLGYAMIIMLIGFEIMRLRKRNIIEKEKLRRATQEKEQEKKVNAMNMSFFANVSHEFRTPLTMIAAPLAQLRDDTALLPGQRQLVDVVQNSVARMLRLVNQLLDFNKLENDTLRLQVKDTDIIALLRQITEIFRINAAEKKIELTIEGLEDSMTATVDADKIEKIVSNLMSNAIKFTPAGGKILFSFDVVDGRIRITVADSGPGIPADQLDKIFERYYQVGNRTIGTYNWGTGIGLYYARALATLHHGTLVASNGESGGAVFTLELPASDVYAHQEHADESNDAFVTGYENPVSGLQQPDNMTHDKTILIVDDDPEVVRYLKILLSPLYSVVTCFNAGEALAKTLETHPDLIISDVAMPDTDGYELTRRIKDDLQICHIPIILVTAKSTIENQVEGLRCGAEAYVTKPFNPNYVLALIQSQLTNREKIRHLLTASTEIADAQASADSELSAMDRSFMNELYALMESELSNAELDINRLTELMHISRTKLYYKVKGLTGTNPGAFFKTFKLNRAAQLLKEGKYTISEIADMTGFSTLSHFSSSFKKQFGVSPSEYSHSL